jgi:parallel beta-helix repeat protein
MFKGKSNMKIILTLAPLLLLSACNQDQIDKILDLSVPTRTPVQNSNPANCPKWDSGKTIKITENMVIPTGCVYDRVAFTISKSNITFDCNGAELNGLGKTEVNEFYRRYKVTEVPRNTAFTISGSENNFLENVTVKNCNLLFYINGFNISFGLKQSTHDDLKAGRNIEALENHLRTLSPKNVRIENNKIMESHKSGIFVQRYITDLIVNNNTIDRASDIGMYLESGTQRITISNSTFSKNGDSTYDIEDRKRKPRVRKREAIAVDSSAYNTIRDNKFVNNAGGAIFMYKNCYERYEEAKQLPRYQGSNFNLIENNHFSDEVKGVWIASRQSRDLNNFKCGDTVIQTKGSEKYYEDFAKNNRVINNTFDNTEKAVIVEDDNNTISNNRFKNTQRKDIIIGATGEVTDVHSVNGTIVKNNVFSSKPGVWLRFNPTGSIFSGNAPLVSVVESSK